MSSKKLLAVLLTIFLSIGFILSGCAKQEEEVEKIVAPEPISDPLKIDTG